VIKIRCFAIETSCLKKNHSLGIIRNNNPVPADYPQLVQDAPDIPVQFVITVNYFPVLNVPNVSKGFIYWKAKRLTAQATWGMCTVFYTRGRPYKACEGVSG
jgi:hypothetical protein